MFSKEEKKKLTEDFWTGFNHFCFSKSYLRGRKKWWILHRTKVNSVHLKFDPGRNSVAVILELCHKSESKRLEKYELIERCKSILEEGFENGLIWDFAFERENKQEVCRIYTKKEGLDIYRREMWVDIYQFMAENMYKLERNFIEIRELIKD